MDLHDNCPTSIAKIPSLIYFKQCYQISLQFSSVSLAVSICLGLLHLLLMKKPSYEKGNVAHISLFLFSIVFCQFFLFLLCFFVYRIVKCDSILCIL